MILNTTYFDLYSSYSGYSITNLKTTTQTYKTYRLGNTIQYRHHITNSYHVSDVHKHK